MENNFKVIQNPDGTYSLEGLRFGETPSPKSQPKVINIKKTSGLANQPIREFYGDFRQYSQKGPTSRYDDDIKGLDRLNYGYSIDELRGEAQPWYDKIAAGIAKGTVLAGTTFADGVVGTVAGLINVVANTDKIYNSDNPVAELGNQFINNPFSSITAEINQNMENILPNYYSKEEQEGPWTDHIFSANFIGDKFLKNLGFTIGAAYSGKVTAGLASKAMGLKGVRDAFKGTVTTASGKVLNTSKDIAKAYRTGDAFMDGIKLTDDLGAAAKKLANAEWKLKTIGAVSGAMGEGRIEAINNSRDWFNYNSGLLGFDSSGVLSDKAKNDIAKEVELQLFEEHPEWFSMVPSGVEGGRYVRMITDPRGQAEWEKRRLAEENKRMQALEKLSLDRARMANVVFAANTAFLTASNMWQFGRFLSGGYTTGRQAKNLVKGSIKEGFTANSREANKQLLKAISNPFVEMNEEMSQALFSETAGLKYASDLNSFYGAKINPDAEKEVSDWLDAIAQGVNNTYGDFDTWEEGALGFMTGLLGIPKVRFKRNTQGKISGLSVTSEGKFWEGIKDYRKIKQESTDVAEALNKRIQSEDFLNYYQGTIRHSKYQSDMEAALDRGDNFNYKNAEHSQFISDAILFDKAGRLQDLYEIIEEGNNVTLDDVNDIRASTIDKNTGKSIYEGKTDEEIVRHVKKQTEDAKEKLDTYVQISNDLKSLYGENISSEHLEELTWMVTQVNDWEGRTQNLIRTIQNTLNKKADILNERFGVNINTTLGNLEWVIDHLADDNDVVDEINSIIEDKNISVEEGRAKIESLIREKEQLRNTSGLKLGNEIAHIRKKARLRRVELQKQYDRLSERLDFFTEEDRKAKEKAEADYKKELERLTKEMYDFYTENSHYANLKLDDLRVQAVDAFDRFVEQSGSMAESLKAVEEYLYKQVILPLSTLEGSRGKSTWEKNRETMARLRQKELSESLFSQIVSLKDMLNSEDYQTVDPLNIKKISDDLIDLIKLYTARSKFISKYTQLADNPELFTQEMQQEAERVISNIQDKEINDIIASLSNISTVKDFRKVLSSVEDKTIRDKVISKLQESDNETLKNLSNNYSEIEEANTIISDIIKGKNNTPEVISASNIIMDALENSNSLEEAKSIIADGIYSVDKPISYEIVNIMDAYVEHQKSTESTRQDKNKPKKKVKKKGALDVATDEDGIPDAEMLEGEEEKSEKKSRSILEEAGKDDDTPDVLQEEEGKPKRKATPDESLKAAKKEDLEDVVAGKSTLQGAENSEEDSGTVKEIAKRELENRYNPPVHSEDNDSSDGNSEVNVVTKQDTLAGYLRSWAVTQYNFNDLKNRDTRRAVQYNDPRVPELIKLGAFEFVDSGKLGDLFNKDNNIPIHYITVSSGPLKNTVLLAIEVVEGVMPINAITAQDNKQYQVVGTLGFNRDNADSTRSYNDLIDFLNDERDSSTSKYFVSSMTNKIRHIYSGRMVKSTEKDTVRQRSLKEVLNGEVPHFGVYYKDGDFRTPTLGDEDEIVPLNTNNSNPREGSIWLMTKEADGRYYAKAVKVGRFNSSYDLEANIDSPIMQRIIENLRIIVDPTKSNYQKSLAKYDLEEVLYFPKGSKLLFDASFKNSNEVIISIEGFENNIGAGLDIEEKIEAILNTLQSDDLDLRFQVLPSKLSNPDYVEELLDSNILTTDIIQIHNVNASFDMYLPNLDTGEPIEDKRPAKGHTGTRGINNELAGDTIIHNGQTYKITDEGVFKDNEQITDQNTIDEVLFISKIKAGTVNPIEGNDRLYIGVYSNGEKFGVVNYRIKTGKELEGLLDKASKVVKKANIEDFRSEWVRVDSRESTIPYEIDQALQEIAASASPFEDVPMEESNLPYEVAKTEGVESSTEEEPEGILGRASRREDKEETLMRKGPSLGSTFNPSNTRSAKELNTNTKNFESLVRANRGVIRELGFKSISELIDFVNNPEYDLPNIETITTQEAFDSLIETIKNCR